MKHLFCAFDIILLFSYYSNIIAKFLADQVCWKCVIALWNLFVLLIYLNWHVLVSWLRPHASYYNPSIFHGLPSPQLPCIFSDYSSAAFIYLDYLRQGSNPSFFSVCQYFLLFRTIVSFHMWPNTKVLDAKGDVLHQRHLTKRCFLACWEWECLRHTLPLLWNTPVVWCVVIMQEWVDDGTCF